MNITVLSCDNVIKINDNRILLSFIFRFTHKKLKKQRTNLSQEIKGRSCVSYSDINININLNFDTMLKKQEHRFKSKKLTSQVDTYKTEIGTYSNENVLSLNLHTVLLVDFLNLLLIGISDRSEAKFKSLDDMIIHIDKIVKKIREIGDFDKVYIHIKSFNLCDGITYNDIPRIVMWCFCRLVPEWRNKICLVLVNGINVRDIEADDRSLFILHDEYKRTMDNSFVFILSNDNFKSMKTHFHRQVTLNFFSVSKIGKSWSETFITPFFNGRFKQEKSVNEKRHYVIIRPDNLRMDLMTIS